MKQPPREKLNAINYKFLLQSFGLYVCSCQSSLFGSDGFLDVLSMVRMKSNLIIYRYLVHCFLFNVNYTYVDLSHLLRVVNLLPTPVMYTSLKIGDIIRVYDLS